MKKYIIQQENGVELIKKFRSDTEAVAFIEDPKNLHTYGDMNLMCKAHDGKWVTWDRTMKNWKP